MNSILTFLLIVNVFNVVLKIKTQSCNLGTYFDGTSCIDCGLVPDLGWINELPNSKEIDQIFHKSWLPTSVRITYQDAYVCSGVLISERTVLTVASCIFKDPNPINYKVIYGLTYKIDNYDSVKGTVIVMHENYDNVNKINDIAVLILHDKITVGQYARVACLPNFPDPFPTVFNKYATCQGWENDPTLPTILTGTLAPIVDPSQNCNYSSNLNSEGAPLKTNFSTQLCIIDVGSPASISKKINGTVKYVLVGINSYGYGKCGNASSSFIYTNVRTFYDWILTKIVY